MNTDEIRQRIDNEPDFINSKRFDYSLERLLERYPDGAPSKVVAQALLMTEEGVEEMYQRVIRKLRTAMKVEV